jgi:hypothetical protein
MSLNFFSKTSLDIHSFIISSIQLQNLDSMYLNALCTFVSWLLDLQHFGIQEAQEIVELR